MVLSLKAVKYARVAVPQRYRLPCSLVWECLAWGHRQTFLWVWDAILTTMVRGWAMLGHPQEAALAAALEHRLEIHHRGHSVRTARHSQCAMGECAILLEDMWCDRPGCSHARRLAA